MIIDIKTQVHSLHKETVSINIEFDPMKQDEERSAALVVTITELIKNYDRLNKLSDEP